MNLKKIILTTNTKLHQKMNNVIIIRRLIQTKICYLCVGDKKNKVSIEFNYFCDFTTPSYTHWVKKSILLIAKHM